jgi:RimJ/RimL family protein N-acetyltransferase
MGEGDWDALSVVASDPLIWEQHPEHDRWKEDVFGRFFDEGLAGGGAFVVVDRQTGAVIGSTRYHNYDADKSEVEIGWSFLAHDYWGGAYNGEVKRLLLDHAFGFVERVVFLVGPTNLRSQRAMEKIGGVLVDCRPDERGKETLVYHIDRGAFRG